LRFLLLCLALLAAFPAFAECGRSGDCAIASGRYLALTPPAWDGKSPLPTMVFLHGYSQTPEDYIEPTGWFAKFGAERGVLIILPEGKDKTWSYLGSPRENRDDAGMILATLDDVEARFPVDRKRLWISGFSQGGSMAWYVACDHGDRFAAATPIAGAFWEPLPATCAKAPINMLHIHGTADKVVPMTGRPIGERWRQGDVMKSLDIFTHSQSCAAADDESNFTIASFEGCRRTVSTCKPKGDVSVYLCTHDGGHSFTRSFLEAGWAFVDDMAKG
jgi:polyhydroxybutyrate depolymerase